MWKIIKTEFAYVKWLIIPSTVIFLGLILKYQIPWLIKNGFLIETGYFLIPYIVHSCILINLVLLYCHEKEMRLRQIAVLPLTVNNLALTILLLPLALAVIYMAIAMLNDLRIPGDILSTWLSGQTEIHGAYYWYRIIPYQGHPASIAVMFFYVLLPWLFTEKLGRYILRIFAAQFVVLGIFLPAFEPQFGWSYGDFIFSTLLAGSVTAGWLLGYVNIIFILVLFISFKIRGSFIY